MALILYPTTGYDTFCDVTTANGILTTNVPGSQRADWEALTVDADKEIYLRQATLLIKNRITLPDTLEDDLKIATAYLANYSIGKDMLDEDRSSGVKRKKIDGVVETEYFSSGSDSNSFPDIVETLLKQYEIVSDGSFTFNRA